MATKQFTIQRRWSWLTAIEVTIECDPTTPGPIKLGLAVKAAFQSRADLMGADLRGAILTGADLRGAILTGADLMGADLTGADLRGAILRGADLMGADLRGAILTGADLTGAILRGADLTGADLRGAILRSADLTGAILRGADLMGADLTGAPSIENIHQTVYAAASQPGALDMSDWHTCGTTHCRAGWVTTLAGEAGKALEDKIGTPAAATLIYLASDPDLECVPNFYCGDIAALNDMQRLAVAEAERSAK